MFNNPYINTYNPQASVDRINSQIAELEKMKSQIPPAIQQPTNLTQNFQIASSNNNTIKYADSIEEVRKDIVVGDTPFFSKDLSVVWIKNTQGNIRTFNLEEIIEKDAKDIQIEMLLARIKEMEESRNESSSKYVDESTKDEKSSSIQSISRNKKK